MSSAWHEVKPIQRTLLIFAPNSHSVNHGRVSINGAIHGSISPVSHFCQETSRVFMHWHLWLCKATINVHIQNPNKWRICYSSPSLPAFQKIISGMGGQGGRERDVLFICVENKYPWFYDHITLKMLVFFFLLLHVMHFRSPIKESLSRENTAGAQLERWLRPNGLAELLIKLDPELGGWWLGNGGGPHTHPQAMARTDFVQETKLWSFWSHMYLSFEKAAP